MESLKTIKKEVERMNGLVDGLLLLAKNDSGSFRYTMDEVDLGKLLNETLEESRLVHPGFHFETVTPKNKKNNLPGVAASQPQRRESYIATCDYYAIQRVVRILVSNAVKYAKQGSTITLAISRVVLNTYCNAKTMQLFL